MHDDRLGYYKRQLPVWPIPDLMTSVSSDSRAAVLPTFPTRRAYFGLAIVFMVFAVYGSLLPFDLQRLPLETAWDRFHTTVLSGSVRRLSRTDVLANVLLFVPVGFALVGSMLVDRTSRLVVVPATFITFAVSIPLSVAVEFLQMFTSDRVPSRTDILAQTVGCAVGIAVWSLTGRDLTRWLRETLAAPPENRLSRLLAGFVAVWLFVSLAPFDITVDLGDLAHRVRSGQIDVIPFAGFDISEPRQLWDGLAETLAAIPLGLLGFVGVRGRPATSRAAAFALGGMLVVCVELAQVFIESHAADATDVVFGWAGTAVGVEIARRLRTDLPQASPTPAGSAVWRGLVLLAMWVVVLCAYHWLPYDFGLDAELIRRKLERMSLLPFAGYRAGSDLNALKDLLLKLALSIPFGVAASYALRRAGLPRRGINAIVLVLAVGVFAIIEAAQLFLPTRVPDPTDVLTGTVGSVIGLAIAQWLRGDSRG